jgi:2-polyprenyl-6-methoxyphenol hydroxylase-like FAD-dependent oxidoreductase
MLSNVHERDLPAPVDKVGVLVDQVAEPGNPLWPGERWWPMELDGPLAVGADGGHGPIRYHVVNHEPGRRVEFRFRTSLGCEMNGSHTLEVLPGPTPDTSRLRHVIVGRPQIPTQLVWHLALARMHDAFIEDMLDNAAEYFGGRRTASWPVSVRVARAFLRLVPPALIPPLGRE